jgi:uncharacterized protein
VESAPPPWHVFLAYLLAVVMIVSTSLLAAAVVTSMYPDRSETAVLQGLPGLLAGGIASSLGLLVTLILVVRPPDPGRLRLLPGRETGRSLLVMVIGMLSLGQALDSLTSLLGLGNRGAMPEIKRALAGAIGPDLFVSVVVIGLLAGTAEEVFFRGYMQAALRRRWRPWAAVATTSLCFAILHVEVIHIVLAFVLALYLGFITELTGSALPAVVCHVVNNGVFTLLAAVGVAVNSPGGNAALTVAAAIAFVACLLWLRRAHVLATR